MESDRQRGAEATISRASYLGREAALKSRPPKSYRLPELDMRIRTARTRSEARIMREAREAGVRTPCIYDIDLKECSITMEYVHGITAKEAIDAHPEDAEKLAEMIGKTAAKLHSAGICHGDLTTSNMIVRPDGSLCLIDFSMGCTKATLEDIGIDARLMERAFGSAHAGLENALETLMDAYLSSMPDGNAVRKKLEEIRNRGRYT
ncbi:MAG: Kae1-associated serine/threonine protein kinase [Candidatus Methanomethylophilaceae archaeon]|nr:Kae1-associated serine/threonine protein kinase [Candidatus Methanomethylophilaceae archaeon]